MGTPLRPAWPAVVPAGLETSALVVLYFVLPVGDRWWPMGVLLGVVVLLAMLPLLVRQARRILRSDRPLADAITTIALVVTLAVVGLASGYYAIATHTTGQFHGIETKLDALYFTVTVLSTTGFGDVRPTGQFARAVTTAQMVFDVVILAVGVRLVTWAARSRASGPASQRRGMTSA